MDTTNDQTDIIKRAQEDPVLLANLLKIDTLIDSLKQENGVSEEYQFIIDGSLTGYFLGNISKDAVLEKIKEQLLIEGDVPEIDAIIKKIATFIETSGPQVQQKDFVSPTTEAGAPTPTEALASVQARLQESVATQPVIKNATFDIKPIVPIAPSASKIDPYRELPQ